MRGYQLEIGYGSSKFAVLGMTMNAANENGGNGVRINCVSPGWVDTGMLDSILAQYAQSGGGYTKQTLRNGTMDRPSTPNGKPYPRCGRQRPWEKRPYTNL